MSPPPASGPGRHAAGRHRTRARIRRERATKGVIAVLLLVCMLGVVVAVRGSSSSNSRPGPALAVWTASSLSRISDTAGPRPQSDAVISAARNESESFQIAVSAGATPVANVDLLLSDLTGPDGSVIPRSRLTAYREHYVDVPTASPSSSRGNRSSGPGRYADALIPFVDPDTGAPLEGELRAAGATVEPQHTQPYWVDVAVPEDAVPGLYTGTYTVTTDHGWVEGQIKLTVDSFTLPKRPALYTAFLNWSGRSSIDRELLRNRIMPGSTVRDVRALDADGSVNATNLGLFSGADQQTCALKEPPSPATVKAAAEERRLPGVLLYNYTADEIGSCSGLTAQVQAWARVLHTAGVKQLVTMTPDRALFTDGAGGAGVDIWTVLPSMYDADPAAVKDAIARGMQVWSYITLVQDSYSPKWLIDYAPINYRIVPGFINQSLGLTGLLYWKVDAWTSDPWNDVLTYEGGYPGEGMLVYPGQQVGLPDGAVPSIRLKWLRDGIDDYDYVQLAKERGLGDQALAITRSVGHDWHTWTKSAQDVASARRELAQLLDSHPQSPTATPDAAQSQGPASVSPTPGAATPGSRP